MTTPSRKRLPLLVALFYVGTSLLILVCAHISIKNAIDSMMREAMRARLNSVLEQLTALDERLEATGMLDAYGPQFREEALRRFAAKSAVENSPLIRAYILDFDGQIVARPEGTEPEHFDARGLVGRLLTHQKGEMEYIEHSVRHWAIFATFQKWHWIVCYTMPVKDKYANAYRLDVQVGGIIVGVTFLATFIGYWVVKRTVVVPIQKANQELKHAQNRLEEKTEMLEKEIEERKRVETEKERMHNELLVTSRHAGMAEVATGVLHNVGNVLNSVNISTTLVIERLQHSKASNLLKVVALMDEHAANLGDFISRDERGRKLPGYLRLLAEAGAAERQELMNELASLRNNVDHIKHIVTMQQNYAKVSGVLEAVALGEVVDDAVRMQSEGYSRHSVQLVRQYEDMPRTLTDKHKVLQILVNLLQNARHACAESDRSDKVVTLRVRRTNVNCARIEVTDNGIGIPAENITQIFSHGFTTRKQGHGFGLHSGALAAKELGGSLSVLSEGRGQGATFALELPLGEPRDGTPA